MFLCWCRRVYDSCCWYHGAKVLLFIEAWHVEFPHELWRPHANSRGMMPGWSHLPSMSTLKLIALSPDFIPLRKRVQAALVPFQGPQKGEEHLTFSFKVTFQSGNARSTHHVRAFHQWSRRSRRVSDTAATPSLRDRWSRRLRIMVSQR